MLAAVVIGVLLAVVSVVAVAVTTFSIDHPGTLWSFLLVPLVGIGMVWMVRGRATNPRTVRRTQLAEAAGIAFFGTCLAIVLLLVGSYGRN
jgi:hypothetical protein